MEKKLSSEIIYEGKIITVYRDKVECENGNIATREVVRHHGGVGVLAIVDGKILLVKQFRYPNATDTLEIPAGKLELNEDTAICAIRELEEETGYNAKKINLIAKFLPTPGYSDEWLYVYEAKDIYQVENPKACDEDEVIELVRLDIDQAYQMVLNGEIFDSKTMIAVYHAYINKHLK